MAFYTQLSTNDNNNHSCHLIELNKINFLIDTGYMQKIDLKTNFRITNFTPSTLDFVVLININLYNIINLVFLVKNGFTGKIICAVSTYKLLKIYFKEDNFIFKDYKDLYTKQELDELLEKFVTPIKLNIKTPLQNNIALTFKNDSYNIGDTYLKVDFFETDIDKSLIFANDITQRTNLISDKLDFFQEGQQVFLGCCSGELNHNTLDLDINSFKEELLQALSTNNTVLICISDLKRMQELIYLLKEFEKDSIFNKTPVFLDSNFALKITTSLLKMPLILNQKIKDSYENKEDFFTFDQLITIRTKEQVSIVDKTSGAKIIITSLDSYSKEKTFSYILKNIENKDNKIFLIGELNKKLDYNIFFKKEDIIKIKNIKYKNRAKIEHYEGFKINKKESSILEKIEDLSYLEKVYLATQDSKKLDYHKELLVHTLKNKVKTIEKNKRIFI